MKEDVCLYSHNAERGGLFDAQKHSPWITAGELQKLVKFWGQRIFWGGWFALIQNK